MALQKYPTVKSAGRFFEILELFDVAREAMTSAQVQRHLDYPQSSTQTLLKSMVSRGFLSFDRLTMTYFPTIRVSTLGNWLVDGEGEQRAESLIADHLAEEIGLACELWCRDDLLVARHDRNGEPEPLFGSIAGFAILTGYAPATISLLRARAEIVEDGFDTGLAAARSAGYALSGGAGSVTIAVALPPWPELPGSAAIVVRGITGARAAAEIATAVSEKCDQERLPRGRQPPLGARRAARRDPS